MKFGLPRFFHVLFCTTVNSSARESKCVPKSVKTLNFIKLGRGDGHVPRPMSEAKKRLYCSRLNVMETF